MLLCCISIISCTPLLPFYLMLFLSDKSSEPTIICAPWRHQQPERRRKNHLRVSRDPAALSLTANPRQLCWTHPPAARLCVPKHWPFLEFSVAGELFHSVHFQFISNFCLRSAELSEPRENSIWQPGTLSGSDWRCQHAELLSLITLHQACGGPAVPGTARKHHAVPTRSWAISRDSTFSKDHRNMWQSFHSAPNHRWRATRATQTSHGTSYRNSWRAAKTVPCRNLITTNSLLQSVLMG